MAGMVTVLEAVPSQVAQWPTVQSSIRPVAPERALVPEVVQALER